MSIRIFWNKIKLEKTSLFFVVIIFLISTLIFALGRLSKVQLTREPVIVEEGNFIHNQNGQVALPASAVNFFVASKNGTKYYLPTCSVAQRIKEENKIWFGSAGEARAAGYQPAANCPGLSGD